MSTRRLVPIALGLALMGGFGWMRFAAPSPSGPGGAERVRQNEARSFTGVVRGRFVTDDGSSLEGMRVVARFAMHQTGMGGEGSARCDADGRFEIRGLGANEFDIGMDAQSVDPRDLGYIPSSVRVRLRRGATRTVPDLALRLGPEITVRIRDALAGVPVKGVVVTAGEPWAKGPVATTDAQGIARFRFDRVVDEPLVLRAFATDGHITGMGETSPDRLLTRRVAAGDRALRVVVVPRAPKG